MKILQRFIHYFFIAALLLLPAAETAQTVEAAGTADFSSYEGKWVDKALIEDEYNTNELTLAFNKQRTKASLILDLSTKQQTNSYWLNTPATVVFNANGLGTFQTTIKVYSIHYDSEEEEEYTVTGSVQLTGTAVKITIKDMPTADLKQLFSTTRTMVRDPYVYRSFTYQEAFAVAASSCACKPSKAIMFYNDEPEEEYSIKPWIHYVTVEVNDIPLKKYKVNLHRSTAVEVKLAPEYYYTSSSVGFKSISASSTLAGSAKNAYSPVNLTDQNTNTCWCEGVKGTGVGQSFTITFEKTTTVYGLTVLPGYGKSVALFLNNGGVKKARIAFSNGTSITADFTSNNNINLDDYGLKPIDTDSITFTILEVRPGAKFTDTCVSEISIH
jgi:hypothetical protein